MTDAREKIGQLVQGESGRVEPWALDRAEDILAALPDIMRGMVKPLVWEEPCKGNNLCHMARTKFGDYYVDVCGGRHQAWMESHTKPYEVEIGDPVGDMFSAKAAAEAHHVSQVMAVFGGNP